VHLDAIQIHGRPVILVRGDHLIQALPAARYQ
jgi:hypothetical protein